MIKTIERPIYYLVISKLGGVQQFTFDDKEEAIQKCTSLNVYAKNAITCEYVRTPDFIYARPLPENTAVDSCMIVMDKHFRFIAKLPLDDFGDYASGVKEYFKPSFLAPIKL